MSQTHQTHRQKAAPLESTPSRADRQSAALVRKGITLQQIHGTQYAVDFLKEKDIDLEIVMRVLLGAAGKRRHDDPFDPAADAVLGAEPDLSFDATLDANPGWSAIDGSRRP